MKFSEKLVQLRKKHGLSQENLAELCHVSRQAVSRWEQGNAIPDMEKLLFLGDYFGVSMDYLLKEKEVGKEMPGSVIASQKEFYFPYRKKHVFRSHQ